MSFLVSTPSVCFYFQVKVQREAMQTGRSCSSRHISDVWIHPKQHNQEMQSMSTGEDVCHIVLLTAEKKAEAQETEDRKQEREIRRAPPKGRTYRTSPLLHMFSSFTVTSDLCPTPFKHTLTYTGIPFPCVKLTTHFCADYETHTQYLICWHTLHHSTHTPDSSRIWALSLRVCVCVKCTQPSYVW